MHTTTDVFSIATFNTHGGIAPTKQYQAIAQAFEQLSLDCITLQEVWSYALLALLRKQLPSYPHVAYTHGLFGPQAGLVTFSRFPLSSVHCITIPPVGEPRKKRFSNRVKRALKKKGVLISSLPLQGFMLCNVYLVANGDNDWSKQNRFYAAHEHDSEQLARLVNSLASQKLDLFVSGDFNIAKCSDLYQQFVERAGVTDVFAGDDTPTFHEAFLSRGTQAHCIDYIFVRSNNGPPPIRKTAHLFQEKVLLNGEALYLSDHLGLMAQLESIATQTQPSSCTGKKGGEEARSVGRYQQ